MWITARLRGEDGRPTATDHEPVGDCARQRMTVARMFRGSSQLPAVIPTAAFRCRPVVEQPLAQLAEPNQDLLALAGKVLLNQPVVIGPDLG